MKLITVVIIIKATSSMKRDGQIKKFTFCSKKKREKKPLRIINSFKTHLNQWMFNSGMLCYCINVFCRQSKTKQIFQRKSERFTFRAHPQNINKIRGGNVFFSSSKNRTNLVSNSSELNKNWNDLICSISFQLRIRESFFF